MKARLLNACIGGFGWAAFFLTIVETRLLLGQWLDGIYDKQMLLVMIFLMGLGCATAVHFAWIGFTSFGLAGAIFLLYLFEDGVTLAGGAALFCLIMTLVFSGAMLRTHSEPD